MVQFTQCGFLTLFYSGTECWDHSQRVTPFGYPGITGYVLLPLAFRSLSRPSSPRSSKASTIHLYSLDHIIVSSSIISFTPSPVWFKLARAWFETNGSNQRLYDHSGAEQNRTRRKSLFTIFSLLLMCAGFRFLPLRLLPSRTIKELSKLSRVLSNAFIFTFPSLIVSNITSVFFRNAQGAFYKTISTGMQSFKARRSGPD